MSWQEIYAHEGEIFGYIKNAVGDGDIARDLYQDVFLSVLQNLSSLDSNRSLKNWLYTIARNRVINYFHYHRRREIVDIDESLFAESGGYDDGLELIEKVMRNLPPRQQEVLQLREKNGLSYEEIAHRMDLSISAVTSLLTRAREKFQRTYVSEFVPEWFARASDSVPMQDMARFLNPFNPPVDLLKRIEQKRSAYFARVARSWNTIREDLLDDDMLVPVWKHVQAGTGLRALDLGCGTGFISLRLAEKGVRTFAVDIQGEMIHHLQTPRLEEMTVISRIHADIRNLPVKAGSMDLIFLVLVLHHISNPTDVVKSCTDLLKRAGTLIIVDYLRHQNKTLADEMSDLWLGFKPEIFRKVAADCGIEIIAEDTFRGKKRMDSFFQVWKKND